MNHVSDPFFNNAIKLSLPLGRATLQIYIKIVYRKKYTIKIKYYGSIVNCSCKKNCLCPVAINIKSIRIKIVSKTLKPLGAIP